MQPIHFPDKSYSLEVPFMTWLTSEKLLDDLTFQVPANKDKMAEGLLFSTLLHDEAE